ncbi:MAG: metal ABC transporter substrate-binding protein [Propionibacteriaceae bacterium]|jgi:zinc transport system substrate-binding protein|nr:metal ABC transporter substrate-binding protein [Propionibacteriaceae bacterium]
MKSVAAACAAVLLTITAGCGSTAPSGDPADDQRLQIVTTIYPYQFLAQGVGGDLVTVTNLTQPGAEPHDLELTARQVSSLSEADLVVFQTGLQPAVDDALEQTQPAQSVDVMAVLARIAEPLTTTDSAHGTVTDPHIWLDPVAMADLALELADRLGQIAPDDAALFASQGAALADRLRELDGDFSSRLAQCQRRSFVASHAAFGYLARRYDLVQIPIAGLSPDAEPSPARMAEIQRLVTDQGITTIFFETLASPALAQSLAGDLGLRTAVLDPAEGLTDQSAAQDYIGLMRADLDALVQANDCA